MTAQHYEESEPKAISHIILRDTSKITLPVLTITHLSMTMQCRTDS